MNLPMKKHSLQSGVSLLELMIGVALASFLLIGLIQIFGASRLAYQTTTGLARVQEGSRFATDFLQRDLRMAGHMGCAGDRLRRRAVGNREADTAAQAAPILGSLFLTNAQYQAGAFNSAPYALRFDFPIHGYEAVGTGRGGAVNASAPTGAWTPALDPALAGLAPAPRAGSDILVLRIFSPDGALLTTTLQGDLPLPATLQIEAGRSDLIEAGGYYGLATCDFALAFQANAADATGTFVVPSSAVNASPRLFPLSKTDEIVSATANVAQVFRLDALVYYVGQGAGGVPSLYRARFVNGAWASEEIVEGVDSMQLLYGRDRLPAANRDGAIEDYVTADQIQVGAVGHQATLMRWNDVLAVQVGLVLRSPQRAGSPDRVAASGVRTVLGVQVNENANEGVLRLPYETSVTLRNRLLGN